MHKALNIRKRFDSIRPEFSEMECSKVYEQNQLGDYYIIHHSVRLC